MSEEAPDKDVYKLLEEQLALGLRNHKMEKSLSDIKEYCRVAPESVAENPTYKIIQRQLNKWMEENPDNIRMVAEKLGIEACLFFDLKHWWKAKV